MKKAEAAERTFWPQRAEASQAKSRVLESGGDSLATLASVATKLVTGPAWSLCSNQLNSFFLKNRNVESRLNRLLDM